VRRVTPNSGSFAAFATQTLPNSAWSNPPQPSQGRGSRRTGSDRRRRSLAIPDRHFGGTRSSQNAERYGLPPIDRNAGSRVVSGDDGVSVTSGDRSGGSDMSQMAVWIQRATASNR